MIGRTLRHYRVTALLGEGGMGVVWKARDTILDRDVALKVLAAGADQGAAARRERFFREAKAASALNHPSIITIYEINSDEGIDFIAMEFVDGRTLSEILRTTVLSVDEALRYAIQVADAVGRAHAAGIVHRDLKPGNIMVKADGLVKVLDFGLAKLVDRSDDDGAGSMDAATRLQLTRVGTTVGSVGYMSPEQAIGDPVDARSDVFSFGVILYQILSGRLPFEAESRQDILRKLHFSEPPPLASGRHGVNDALSAVVARTLAKKPADRYADLSEVASALRALTAPAVVASTVAPPPPPPPRRTMPWRTIAAAAAVVVVIAAGTWVWRKPGGVFRGPGSASSADAGAPPDLTRQAAALLERQDKEGNVDAAIGLLERALAADQHSAVALAYLSDAYVRRQQMNPDPQWLKLARDAAQRAVAENGDLALAHQSMAFVHYAAGERDLAAREFRRAADLDPMSPFPPMGLGLIAAAQNDNVEAESALRKAVQLGPKAWRPHNELGDFFYRHARYEEAAREWETARDVTPDNALVLRNLSAAYYSLGRHDAAASALQRALEVRPSAPIYTNLGTIRFFQGRYADAVAAFEKAVELGANRYLNWGNLGDGLRWAPGRRSEAAAAYQRASDLVRQQIADKPHDLDLRTRHALYLVKMGKTNDALGEIQEAVASPQLTAQMWYRLTVVYELAGDRVRAIAALERALKAGYPAKELENEPELIQLRADSRYHRLLASREASSAR